MIRTSWTREGLLGTELCRKTLGVVGFGVIGQEVARIGVAFGAKVLVYDVKVNMDTVKRIGVEVVDLTSLLKQSDIVTIHAPLLDSTKGLIGEWEIGVMKKGAILINAARGPLVAKEPLVQALANGRISAGIDVYDVEPLPLDDPLLSVGNTVLTPHIGFYTREGLKTRTRIAFENIKSFIEGKSRNVVNPEALSS